jgi:hypothetical protein
MTQTVEVETTTQPCPECSRSQDRGRFCAHCGALLAAPGLGRGGVPGGATSDPHPDGGPATGRRLPQPRVLARVGAGLVAVVVVAVLLPPITLEALEAPRQPAAELPPSGTQPSGIEGSGTEPSDAEPTRTDPPDTGPSGTDPPDPEATGTEPSDTAPLEWPTGPSATTDQPVTTPRSAGPRSVADGEIEEEAAVDDPFPRFLRRTDTVLVLDDGSTGGITLDLDTGVTGPVELPQRAGDQPYRLGRLGDQVVVGWGEIRAVSLAADVPDVRALPDATIFVPAAEPDQLWLLAYPGGRTGRGLVTATLVDADGSTLATLEADLDGAEVLRGVPGGLGTRTADGRLERIGVDGTTEVYPATDARHLVDAAAGRVVWCEDPCSELQVSDGTGRVVHAVAGHGVSTFHPDEAWLSPDGERIAAVVTTTDADGRAVTRQLRVHLVENATLLARASLPDGGLRGSWTPDGRRFVYALSSSPGSGDRTPQQLGVWAVGGVIEQVDVTPRLEGLGALVALPRHAVQLD